MRNAGAAFDAAEKPPRPTAPPMDSPMQQPLHSDFYAARPVQDTPAAAYRQPPMPPMPPMPHMPPMAPLPPLATQHSGYFQPPVPPHAQPKYEAQYLHPPVPPATPMPHPYPYHANSITSDDSEEEDSTFPEFLRETGRLVLFHTLNAILGYVAFTVCVGGVATSVGLLPLCCFGIVVFRVVLYAVYGFAQLDVMLFNFITPPEDHVYTQVPENPRAGGLSGSRLSPTLSAFSPLSLMALIYFCSIKFVVSTLSSVCFSLVVTVPLSLLCAMLGLGHGPVFQVQFGPEDLVDFDDDPLLFLLATASLFAIGVALLHVVASASRAATKFFCCEKFSTYRYVHHPSLECQALYPTATMAGGHSAPPPYPHQGYGAVPMADPYNTSSNQAPAASRGAVVIRFNTGGT